MLKIGILGGGQLGRMLLQAAANYPVETYVMENDSHCPAAHLCHHFVKGDIRDFDEVLAFGRNLDAITIEIESVNEQALEVLSASGIAVFPKPQALRIIKNKILQKEFYKQLQVPTAEFMITKSRQDISSHEHMLPAVHKLGEGGYDGRGVQVIATREEISKGFDAPGVLEKMVDIEKEISIIVAVDKKGEMVLYPPVDMVFDPSLNLLDYQISPADIPEQTRWKMEAMAIAVVKGLQSPGIFAVEMFIDKKGEVYVNETAPRVHNSGHHSIEANYSSQFDMLLRIMMEYPLGNTRHILSASIVNLLGEDGYSGEAHYEGMEEVLKMENVFIHLYGKKETRPGRKMGHATILSNDKQDLIYKAHRIKKILKVISK